MAPNTRNNVEDSGAVTTGAPPTNWLFTMSALTELTVYPAGRLKKGPDVGKEKVLKKLLTALRSAVVVSPSTPVFAPS
jgi:hypothetical protein